MCTKFISLCFLFCITFTFCSECTDKTSLGKGEDHEICYDLESSADKICIYDESTKGCKEKGCTELPIDKCDYIGSKYDEKNNLLHCLPKSDKSGCAYQTCEDLKSDCSKYRPKEENEICAANSANNGCEIKRCSDLTQKCEEFISNYVEYKCALKGGACQITAKDCDELDINKCNYYSFNNDETKCILDSKTNKCKLTTCEQLPNTECTKFKLYNYDDPKVCAPSGNNCKIQTCSDFSKDVCETVKFGDPDSKCVYSQKGCTYDNCHSQDPKKCSSFVPLDKLYKCDGDGDSCYIESKECEELSKGECDLFNIEDNLEETKGKKCVYSDDKGKCVLASKRLEFSALISILLLLIY